MLRLYQVKDQKEQELEHMNPFKVICIDDTDQPPMLPIGRRVKEGETYTVIEVAYMKLQSVQGFKLLELDCSFPYEYFKASRFLPLQELVEQEEAHLEEAI
jgi:hypothetical protein